LEIAHHDLVITGLCVEQQQQQQRQRSMAGVQVYNGIKASTLLISATTID
jgi:hypothetical protein